MKAAGCFPRSESKEILGALVSEQQPALTRAGTSKQVGERRDLPHISTRSPLDLPHVPSRWASGGDR